MPEMPADHSPVANGIRLKADAGGEPKRSVGLSAVAHMCELASHKAHLSKGRAVCTWNSYMKMNMNRLNWLDKFV